MRSKIGVIKSKMGTIGSKMGRKFEQKKKSKFGQSLLPGRDSLDETSLMNQPPFLGGRTAWALLSWGGNVDYSNTTDKTNGMYWNRVLFSVLQYYAVLYCLQFHHLTGLLQSDWSRQNSVLANKTVTRVLRRSFPKKGGWFMWLGQD